jgi:hypothetical protein
MVVFSDTYVLANGIEDPPPLLQGYHLETQDHIVVLWEIRG